jgi:hypothetical protein
VGLLTMSELAGLGQAFAPGSSRTMRPSFAKRKPASPRLGPVHKRWIGRVGRPRRKTREPAKRRTRRKPIRPSFAKRKPASPRLGPVHKRWIGRVGRKRERPIRKPPPAPPDQSWFARLAAILPFM